MCTCHLSNHPSLADRLKLEIEPDTARMEDIKNFSNINGNQMELLLEFDEEEASLIEEMERQEAPQIARSTSRESLAQLEGVDANVQKDLELTEFPEDRVENGAASSLEDDRSVENSVDEHLENTKCLASYEHSNNAEGVDSHQENSERFVENSLNSSKESTEKKTLEDNEESSDEPLTQCFLEGVQILRLDMSESELLFAKSAAALKSQSFQSVSMMPDIVHSQSQSSVGSEDPVSGPVNVGATSGKAPEFLNCISTSDEEERYLRCILNTQREEFVKSTSGTERRTKIKTRTKKSLSTKKRQITKDQITIRPTDDCSSVPAKKRRLGTVGLQEARVVNFHCVQCDFKCPFKKENIDKIVKHITPRERFNQLHEIPVKLKNFRENIKLSVMIAKNKAKAWVRLSSRLQCINCHQYFPLDVEGCDQVVIHYTWCQELFSREKFFSCPYCNDLVHRGSIKKHLGLKSKRQCTKNVAVTLQLMSCVCKWYAERHRPVCIVCNEKCWPYLGHRAELHPVCETCRFNIISGNTTKLRDRDLAGCAICGWQCSEKFVTYWASELESLFIGEHCISKLESPVTQKAVEMANMKEAKVRKLLETALASPDIQKEHSKDMSSDVAVSAKESSGSTSSKMYKSSENVYEKAQTDNTDSDNVLCLNEWSSNNDSQSFVFSNTSKLLKSDGCLVNQTTEKDLGRITGKNRTKAPVTKTISKQIKPTQYDLPAPTRATTGGFIPITGSFQINNKSKLPFASIASVKDNPSDGKTLVSKASIDIDEVKSIVQSGVPYTLLLPDDTPRVLFRRCLPKITSDGVESPKTVFRPIKPHPEITCKSEDNDLLKAVVMQSRENPVCHSGIAKMTLSTRSKSEGIDLSNESSNQSNQVGHSCSTSFQVSMKAQQPKYIIKYVSTLTDSSQKNSDHHDNKKSPCIIIKTSSSTMKTEAHHESNQPWVAKIIKTPNDVCSEDWQGNGKVFERKRERKPMMKVKQDNEIVNLD